MQAQAPRIELGRRVHHWAGYAFSANCDGLIVAIHGEPGAAHDRVIGPMTIVNANACTFDVITFDGQLWRGCRESCIDRPGIGRIDLLDKVHGPAMIERAHRLVAEKDAADALAKADAEQRHADAIEALVAENPHLERVGQYARHAVVAKNVRAALKHAGLKPKSVRTARGSMCSSIDVVMPKDCSDAELELADKIARRFRDGHFNSMEDIYEYDRYNAWTAAFGGVRYCDAERDRE